MIKTIKQYPGIILVTLIYILLFLIIKPANYSFPLNDDWVYGYSVEKLLQTGQLRLSDYSAATSVTQIFWGYMFCKLFKVTQGIEIYSILRLSTFIASFISMIFFYLLLKRLKIIEFNCISGTILLIFNPLFFVLSCTFMTDIHYLFYLILSLYFYIIGLEKTGKHEILYLLLGSLFAGLAYLVRQLGILIPISVLFYLYVNKKIAVNRGIYIILLPIIIYTAHWYWLNYIHLQTWVYMAGTVIKLDFSQLIPRILCSFIYCGLFILPLLFIKPQNKPAKKQNNSIYYVILTIIIIITILWKGYLPYFENTIHKYGLGTITLGNSVLKTEGILSNTKFWAFLTLLSGICFIKLFNIFRINLINNSKNLYLLVVMTFILQFLVSLVRFKLFDRYLIVLIPFLIITMLISAKKSYISYFGILLFAGYSILGTIDYLAWNKAKWELANKIVNSGYLQPNEIANGFDWDGYFTFQNNIEILKALKPAKSIGEWDWQMLNKYRVSTGYYNSRIENPVIDKTEYFDVFTGTTKQIAVYKLQ